MAQPKKKTSHQKQAQRRAKNYLSIIKVPTLTVCPGCNEAARPHQICTNCGYYRGRPARRADNPALQ
jgi:large subunit ribosomal protein L32